VYVALRGAATSNVLGYTIGANGALTPFPSGPVSAGNAPRSIGFDPSGRFVYVANETSGDVSVFTITAGGVLSPGASAAAGNLPWTAAVDPSGAFAYAVNQGSGEVTMFRINSTDGTLSKTGSVAARFSPGSIAFTRGTSAVSYTPRFAYTANLGSTPGDISAFRIDAGSGALTLIGTPVASGGTQPFPIAAHPSGRFLYVGHQGSDDVAAFSINATTGALTAIGTPVATGGADADGLTVDPSGRFAYAGNVDGANPGTPANQTISLFSIDATTGAIATVGSPVASGGLQPFSPAVDPSGRFLYTANFNSANVSAFRINPANGVLSAITGQPFSVTVASGPFSLVVSPSGRFVYVANKSTSNVSVFAINLADGSLSEISGSPYAAGSGPRSIATHPSGRFVYVDNENDSTVHAYQVDPSTGVLTLVTGSPFAVGGGPRPLTVDPSGRFLYVGRTGAGGVSAFAINQTTGALVLPEIGGAPAPTGDGVNTGISPFGITTTGTIQ
jgi:6-phosphogluconolactonase (cycloisomerase 2 family)